MIIEKLLKKLVVALMLVAIGTTITSCHNDNDGQSGGGNDEPDVEYRAGDNFYRYANAEWFKSLKGSDPKKNHSWFGSIQDANNKKVQEIKDNMPEYKALKSSLSKLNANAAISEAIVAEILNRLFGNIETKEQAYVVFGKLISLGLSEFGTINTAICSEDSTVGYSINLPVDKMVEEPASLFHTPDIKRLPRYASTRSNSVVVDKILEGIGLDPKYYLHNNGYDGMFAEFENLPLGEFVMAMVEGAQTQLMLYCSDDVVKETSDGKYKSVSEYIYDTIENDLGYFTSYNFCNTYVNEDMQRSFAEMGNNLISTFRTRIQNNTWLSPATIAEALDKLDNMDRAYGNIEKWPVTEVAPLDGEYLIADVLDIKARRYDIIKSILGKPAREYLPIVVMYSIPNEAFNLYAVNAYYVPAANSFFVLPTFMIDPAYSTSAPEAAFYGTLGFIICHEMTHGYDKVGATYNKYGQIENWWTEEDLAKFTVLNERRVANVSTFEILPGMQANGKQTVTEDVADLGGVCIAYNAWLNHLTERGVTGEELLEQKRAFFSYYAMTHREKVTEQYMIERASEDTHSPGHIRINSVVQHIDEWYDLFDVQEGDALYLTPEERIYIW